MRFKKNTFLITLAAVLCIAAFPFSASANIDESYDEEISVNDDVESKTPLTPSGNLTVIDDVHQTTDEDAIEDKQFITVQSKNGNTFYIIIDRSGDTENVYFLNAVDEADLLALTEDAEQNAPAATCICTTKCETGSVNANCEVCAKNKDECRGVPASTSEQSTEKEEKPDEETPQNKQNTTMPLIGLIIFALFGGGGALYWFKVKNKKPSTKGTTDINDLFEDDEDYNEETEVETDNEHEYETEDEDAELSDDETDGEIGESEVED